MEHFTTDVMKLGPAPTVAREIPVTIANILFTVIAVAVLIALRGGVDAVVIGFAVICGGYSISRLAWAAARRPSSGSDG